MIPSGIYTDLGAKQLREMLFEYSKITGLFGFENRKTIFEGVDSRFKFVALSFVKGQSTTSFPAAFMRHDVNELAAFPNRDSLEIGVDLVRKLSPDSLSVMEFKSEKDVEIAEKMLQFPLLGEKRDDVWNLSLGREFDMSIDSGLFRSDSDGKLALYEGKMIHQFEHQLAKPRYWIGEKEGRKSLLGRTPDNGQKVNYELYRVAHRAIARNTDSRTMIATVLPPKTFFGHSMNASRIGLKAEETLYVCAILNSFAFDYILRLQVTANLTLNFVYQTPVPRLSTRDVAFLPIVTRAAKLICTTPEFDDLAKAAGIGTHANGATDADERATLRAELDALVARLYGLDEAEFAHILATFPLVSEPTRLAARNKFRDLERGVFVP